MSSDFVFVEIPPNSDHPLIDGISLNRLNKEWNAVKIDIKEPENQISDSSISVWDKLLSIYNELEQVNKESANIFSQNCIKDIHYMLSDIQYQRSQRQLFSFFISFMKIKNSTFLDIDKAYSISILNSLIQSYQFLQQDFLDDFLNIFKADEIEDDQGTYPFYTFIVKSYPNEDKIGEKSRSISIQIVKEKKHNLNYFLTVFIDSIVDLFCIFSSISPTIFDNSHPVALCRFFDTFFCLIETEIEYHSELIEKYSMNLQKRMIENLKDSPPLIQFETFNFFFSSLHHTKTTSLFIHYLIQNDNVFSQNVQSWLEKWPNKVLIFFSILIDLRSSALQKAYFYEDDHFEFNSNEVEFSFPDYPIGFIQKVEKKPLSILSIDDFSVYQSINGDLPSTSNHITSLLKLMLSLFYTFWDLPIQTDEILITVIEKVACCGSESTNLFCFLPGKGIYEATEKLLSEAENADKEKKVLLADFILTMKEILTDLKIWKK